MAVGDPDRLVSDRPDGGPGQLRGRLQEEAPRQIQVDGSGRAELCEIALVDPFHPPGELQQALGALVGVPGIPEGLGRPVEEREERRTGGVHDPVARLLVEEAEQRSRKPQRIPARGSFGIGGLEQRVLHHQRAGERGGEPSGRIRPEEQFFDRQGGSADLREDGRAPPREQLAPQRLAERGARAARAGQDQRRRRRAADALGEVGAQRPPIGKAPDSDPARSFGTGRGSVHCRGIIWTGQVISCHSAHRGRGRRSGCSPGVTGPGHW